MVERALVRLAAGRSAWNPADVRGEVERLIAAEGVVVEPGVRLELAEDLTARAMRECAPLLDGDGVPEHIRAWTSQPVLATEAGLIDRLEEQGRRLIVVTPTKKAARVAAAEVGTAAGSALWATGSPPGSSGPTWS